MWRTAFFSNLTALATCTLLACSPSPDNPLPPCTPEGEPCDPGSVCIEQACYEVCQQPSDCPPSHVCTDGACLPGAGECASNAECDSPPEACRAVPGTCSGGECTYEALGDGERCEVEIIAGNNRVGTCQDGTCVVFCPTDGNDCPTGSFCDGTYCSLLRDLGAPCQANDWCVSGKCVDGHCCDSDCTETCHSCNPDESTASAGCAPTQRGKGFDDCPNQWACNGQGACFSKGPGDTDCSNDYECRRGNCAAGICAGYTKNGNDCDYDYDCESGHCVEESQGDVSQKFCCDGACTGPCQSCLAAYTSETENGSCTPIPPNQDPYNGCASRDKCDGSGQCVPLSIDLTIALPMQSDTSNAFPLIEVSDNALAPEYTCTTELVPDSYRCEPPQQIGPLEAGQQEVSVSVASTEQATDELATDAEMLTVDPSLPIAWWRLDDDLGTNVLDHTSSRNDATRMESDAAEAASDTGPLWSSDRVFGKSALRFQADGDGHVRVQPANSLAHLRTFTIAAWVKPELGNSPQTLLDHGDGTIQMNLTSEGHPEFVVNETSLVAEQVHLQPDRFQHLAVSFDGSVVRAYFNGLPVAQTDAQPIDSSVLNGTLILGADHNLDRPFQGIVDEIRVFHYPLDNEALRAESAGAMLDFDAASGTRVVDHSPQQHDGSIVNAAEPQWVAREEGQALRLSRDAYVDLGKADVAEQTGTITVSAWVKPESSSELMQVVARRSNETGYALSILPESDSACGNEAVFYVDGKGVCSGVPIPRDGEWTLLQGSYDGSALSLSVNHHTTAVRPDATGLLSDEADTELTIGQDFVGAIDDVRIMPTAIEHVPSSCQGIVESGLNSGNGEYTIDLRRNGNPADGFPVYCDMTTDGGGWTMVYKITSGIYGRPHALWTGDPVNEDDGLLLNVQSSGAHYVNRIVSDFWNANGFLIDQARVNLYQGGTLEAYFAFDATGTANQDWFRPEQVSSSSTEPPRQLGWETQRPDTAAGRYFSISGHAEHYRRWFINNNYGGCDSDAGWLIVDAGSTEAGGDPCDWENPAEDAIEILYAPSADPVNYDQGEHAQADVLAVFVR